MTTYERDVLLVLAAYRLPLNETTLLGHYYPREHDHVLATLRKLVAGGTLCCTNGFYRRKDPA